MTQHGLAGMKTPGTRQGGRQVQDKTYWQGEIRAKMSEICQEIERLEKEQQNQEEEAESFLSYKRMAGQNAKELQELQSRLSDANTVVEKNNQGLDDEDIENERVTIQGNNEVEEESLHNLFNMRQEREAELKQIDQQIEEYVHQTQMLLGEMSEIEKGQFLTQQKQYQKVTGEIDEMEKEIEQTRIQSHQLENDLLADPVRSNLVPFYADLLNLKEKKKHQDYEERNKLTPEQERDKLLKQTKNDNSTIATIEKQIASFDDKINTLHDQIRNMESDLDESYLQKIKGLRQTEQKFKSFLSTYPSYRDEEEGRISEKEEKVVEILEETSKIIHVTQTLPEEAAAFSSISTNLKHKEKELDQNIDTMENLSHDQTKLAKQLRKIEEMEKKLETEKISLGQELDKLSGELAEYNNIEALEERENEKKEILLAARDRLKNELKFLSEIVAEEKQKIAECEAALGDSDEHNTMINLEKRWNNQQQTNQAMAEFISNRSIDTNGLQQRCRQYLVEYNQVLLEQLKNQTQHATTQGY
jgi:intraflagellar transport protein 74